MAYQIVFYEFHHHWEVRIFIRYARYVKKSKYVLSPKIFHLSMLLLLMRRNRCYVLVSKGFFKTYGALYVRAFEWLILLVNFCHLLTFIKIVLVFIVIAFLSFVFLLIFVFIIVCAECSFSYSLFYLQLSLIFHEVFCINQFMCIIAIFSFANYQLIFIGCVGWVLASWLFLLIVWIDYYFGWWVDFEAGLCCNLVLVCYLKGYF